MASIEDHDIDIEAREQAILKEMNFSGCTRIGFNEVNKGIKPKYTQAHEKAASIHGKRSPKERGLTLFGQDGKSTGSCAELGNDSFIG